MSCGRSGLGLPDPGQSLVERRPNFLLGEFLDTGELLQCVSKVRRDRLDDLGGPRTEFDVLARGGDAIRRKVGDPSLQWLPVQGRDQSLRFRPHPPSLGVAQELVTEARPGLLRAVPRALRLTDQRGPRVLVKGAGIAGAGGNAIPSEIVDPRSQR